MIERRSLFHALPLAAGIAVTSDAQTPPPPQGPSVVANTRTVHAAQYGAVGDGRVDDTDALQAALNAAAGRTLYLDSSRYRTTRTLLVSGHGTHISGEGAVIEYYGDGPALGFELVNKKLYPVEIWIGRLLINVNRGSGIEVKASHSSFDDVKITLRPGADRAIGFDLVGDEPTGTGPYYNTFKNCSVQGQGPQQIGVRFRSIAPEWRGPNANTWLGGRVGQCDIGFLVTGCGNHLFNPTLEGCGTAVRFESAYENHIFGCYLELCRTGFEFAADSSGNGLVGAFHTGVPTFLDDRGSQNWTLSDAAPGRLPVGVTFGKPSPDPAVLDYYGEGEWQPSLTGERIPGKFQIKRSSAKFVRVGRQVTLSARMTIDVHDVGAGTARFGGLPFLRASDSTMVGLALTSGIKWPANTRSICALPWSANADRSFLLGAQRDSADPYHLEADKIETGSVVELSATYFAAE